MRRGTIIFIVFALIVAAIVGVSQFLRLQPPLEFTVAVNPLAADWAREAVAALNTTEPIIGATQRVQFNVIVVNDPGVWQGSENWTTDNHPAAWLPASSMSVTYADRYAVQVPSLARTPLVWGGYASRVAVATNDGTQPLDWAAVQAAAQAESWSNIGGQANWRFIKLAFARPDQSMTGLAVLLSAAGSFNTSADISGTATRSNNFRGWLTPIIDSMQSFSGADAAQAMARGPSTIEMALLPESQWLLNLNGLVSNEPLVLNYPAYQFMLDFPLARWSDTAPNIDQERMAVAMLGEWLLRPAQQARLVDYGLRPADDEPDSSAALFLAAEPYGIQLEPDFGQAVQPPSRSETQGLIQWFSQTQRR